MRQNKVEGLFILLAAAVPIFLLVMASRRWWGQVTSVRQLTWREVSAFLGLVVASCPPLSFVYLVWISQVRGGFGQEFSTVLPWVGVNVTLCIVAVGCSLVSKPCIRVWLLWSSLLSLAVWLMIRIAM